VFVSDTNARAYLPAGTALNLRIFLPTASPVTCTVAGHVIDAAL
jgi:hypothetical protein